MDTLELGMLPNRTMRASATVFVACLFVSLVEAQQDVGGARSPVTPWLTASLVALIGMGMLYWRSRIQASQFQGQLDALKAQLETEVEARKQDVFVREALQQRLSRAERLESLGALVGGIAHDFNNLLVGVICNAQLLQRPDLNPVARERCIEGILQSAEKATELSRKMRSYSGREPSLRQSIDLVSLVQRLQPVLQATLMEGVPIECEFTSSTCIAHADEAQVETILMGLAANARDATQSSNGNVTIRVGTEVIADVASDAQLVGERTAGGQFSYVEMEDTGAGLGADELQQIFEPFYTTKDGGRGMGLTVVLSLTNRQDGLIRCTSQPGRGTTMRVLLPAETERDAHLTKTESESSLRPHGLLVVVDDEPSILEVVSKAFATLNWETATFLSGTEAVAFVRQNADRVTCVLLDAIMPGMDGRDVAEQLSQLEKRIPIVVSSGYSSTNLQEFVQMPNVRATLTKPYSVADLASAVNRAISDE